MRSVLVSVAAFGLALLFATPTSAGLRCWNEIVGEVESPREVAGVRPCPEGDPCLFDYETTVEVLELWKGRFYSLGTPPWVFCFPCLPDTWYSLVGPPDWRVAWHAQDGTLLRVDDSSPWGENGTIPLQAASGVVSFAGPHVDENFSLTVEVPC